MNIIEIKLVFQLLDVFLVKRLRLRLHVFGRKSFTSTLAPDMPSVLTIALERKRLSTRAIPLDKHFDFSTNSIIQSNDIYELIQI